MISNGDVYFGGRKATCRNGYVLDLEGNVIGTYRNGYVFNPDGEIEKTKMCRSKWSAHFIMNRDGIMCIFNLNAHNRITS